MKIFLIIFILFNLSTCSEVTKMENDFSHILEQEKNIDIFKIDYVAYSTKDTSFYKGYSIEDKVTIKRKLIKRLANTLKDSSNYSLNISKNCVLTATYGLKLSDYSSRYIVFIGKQPCIKISILEEIQNSETTMDLTDNNTILPFLDSLFNK